MIKYNVVIRYSYSGVENTFSTIVFGSDLIEAQKRFIRMFRTMFSKSLDVVILSLSTNLISE